MEGRPPTDNETLLLVIFVVCFTIVMVTALVGMFVTEIRTKGKK
jgi:hypothetical protein